VFVIIFALKIAERAERKNHS